MPDFHVVIWRDGPGKLLGLKVGVADDFLRIFSIHGSQMEEMNRRCRTCCVQQILEQQLLEKDCVVNVNGKTVLKDMLRVLSDVSVPCLHLRVRRYSSSGIAHVGGVRAESAVAGVLNEQRMVSDHNTISSSSSAVVPGGSSQCRLARVIKTYDPIDEPERGYLGVVEGTVVAVQAGSSAPPEVLNQFDCPYVYVWTPGWGQLKGWVPERILDLSGQ